MATTHKWVENNPKSEESNIWDKEAEPVLEGKLTQIETSVGPNESNLYSIKKDDGTVVKVWGSTVLDDRFLGVIAGTYVRVSYKGLTKGKNGKSYHNYSVDVDQDSAPQVEERGDISAKDEVILDDDQPITLTDEDFLKSIPF